MLLGGVGEINFGKQYRQGNRIYDSNHIAMCVLSQPVGNAGGFSYLYAVEQPMLIDDTYGYDGTRLYKDYCPTLRSERHGLKVCVAMRGRYNENGAIKQHLEPRYDGLTNTITTVTKDNLIMESK